MLWIEIGGGDGALLSRGLGIMADAMRDMRPIWESVVIPWARDHFKRQFETDGEEGGQKWVGYGAEPKYAEYKEEAVGHTNLLRWEMGGRYEAVYPSLVSGNHPNSYMRMTATSLSIGTTVPHAADLERSTIGPFNEPSPPRYIMVAGQQKKKALITQIQRAILQQLQAEGLSIGAVRASY